MRPPFLVFIVLLLFVYILIAVCLLVVSDTVVLIKIFFYLPSHDAHRPLTCFASLLQRVRGFGPRVCFCICDSREGVMLQRYSYSDAVTLLDC